MQKILDSVGVVCEVVGLTGRSSSNIRGVEIREYIEEHVRIKDYTSTAYQHEFTNYVILDDDSDMLLWQKDNFVQTDGQRGLTKSDVWKAINILNRGEGL